LLGTLLCSAFVTSCAQTSRVVALPPPESCLVCDEEPMQSTDDSPASVAADYNAIRSAGSDCRSAVADCADWAATLP
jgi:hypothetical protein